MRTARARRRAVVLLSVVSAVGMLSPACGSEESVARAPRLRAERPRVPTDEELTSYLEWLRDWKHLANRNRTELEAGLEPIFARYPSRDPNAVASDPEWLALHRRQAEGMQAHMNRRPRGLIINALEATLPGVGRMVARTDAMDYVPGRDEAVLSAARARYGNEFVDWVLARERVIVETLSRSP